MKYRISGSLTDQILTILEDSINPLRVRTIHEKLGGDSAGDIADIRKILSNLRKHGYTDCITQYSYSGKDDNRSRFYWMPTGKKLPLRGADD